MMTQNITVKEYFKSLKIIFFALIAVQILFTLVSLYIVRSNGPLVQDDTLSRKLMPVVAVLVLVGIYIGNFIVRKRQKSPWVDQPISEKLAKYRALLITKFALIEGPSFISIVAFLLTGSYSFLLFTLLILVIFFTHLPTPDKLIYDLKFNREEQEKVKNPDSVIE